MTTEDTPPESPSSPKSDNTAKGLFESSVVSPEEEEEVLPSPEKKEKKRKERRKEKEKEKEKGL